MKKIQLTLAFDESHQISKHTYRLIVSYLTDAAKFYRAVGNKNGNTAQLNRARLINKLVKKLKE